MHWPIGSLVTDQQSLSAIGHPRSQQRAARMQVWGHGSRSLLMLGAGLPSSAEKSESEAVGEVALGVEVSWDGRARQNVLAASELAAHDDGERLNRTTTAVRVSAVLR
jgi:hypothetical protein